MIHRYRGGRVVERCPAEAQGAEGAGAGRATARLKRACEDAPARIDEALAGFDFRGATRALWAIVEEANRAVDATRPWEIAKAERSGDPRAATELDCVLSALLHACARLGDLLAPFLPGGADRIVRQCTAVDGLLPEPVRLFPALGR